jgi:hypothetical protein
MTENSKTILSRAFLNLRTACGFAAAAFLACGLLTGGMPAASAKVIERPELLHKYEPISETQLKDIMQAYGHYKMRFALFKAAGDKFPDLKPAVDQTASVFKYTTYGKGAETLVSFVEALYSKDYLRGLLEGPFKTEFKKNVGLMTRDYALYFLELFKSGYICDEGQEKVCSQFLRMNDSLADRPNLAFSEGLLQKISTKGHPKSQGLVATIEIPSYWVVKEGRRPHVLWRFNGVNRYGFLPQTVFVINRYVEDEDYRQLPQNYKDNWLHDEDVVREIAGELGNSVMSVKKTFMGSAPVLLMELRHTAEQLEKSITMRSLVTYVQYRNFLININLGVSTLGGGSERLEAEYQKYRPLYMLILNSLTIQNPYL